MPNKATPEELLEQFRTASAVELVRREPDELERACNAAQWRAKAAQGVKGRIMSAANGREPTQAQKADITAADAELREFTELAGRLNDATQESRRLGDEFMVEQLSKVVQTVPVEDPTADYRRSGYENQTRHTGGGHTYAQQDVRTSWVRDMKALAENGDPSARDRLVRNNREWAQAPENRALAGNIAGAVSEFVPPVWAMNLMATVARPGRVFADNINNLPLPQTNSVPIPRLLTGTAVAGQSTENSAVQNTDATSDSITATVHTLGGTQVLSNQLIDQSPVSMDQIILQDLAADLAVKTDQFVLSSNATGKVGILNLSGVNTITYTSGAPLVKELYPKLADGIQRISTSRYFPPEKIFVHPRRWAWLTAAVDTAGRPLVVPLVQMPQNSIAAQGGVVAEGLVGSIMGLPIFTDPSIPTNLGAGTNQDPIIIMRTSDSYLWESPVFVMPDRITLSNQLSTRITISRYVAVQHGRYPAATSIVNGTGTIAPTF